jgi:hypothetical protein
MAGSSEEAILTLRRAVHDDPVLQARLFALTDASEFVAAVLQIAHSQGIGLQEEAVWQAMRCGRRSWSDRKRP